MGRWTDRTKPIVRLDIGNRMVTKGYRKGVYERVTKGIRGESTLGAAGEDACRTAAEDGGATLV
jgi:hypothetical protein